MALRSKYVLHFNPLHTQRCSGEYKLLWETSDLAERPSGRLAPGTGPQARCTDA